MIFTELMVNANKYEINSASDDIIGLFLFSKRLLLLLV